MSLLFVYSVLLLLLVLVPTSHSQSATVTITKPLKGDKLVSGSKATIEWTSTGLLPDAPIGIELWDARSWSLGGFEIFDREDKNALQARTSNTGSFEFFVPDIDESDSSYYAVVYSYVDRRINSKSQEFSVEASDYSLTASEPAKDATLTAGESVTVRWTSNSPSDATLRILFKQQKGLLERAFSIENDVLVAVVAEAAPNSGEFVWSVPLSVPIGERYHFELLWELNGLSSATPHCRVQAGSKTLQIVQPASNTLWELTSTQKTVEWAAVGFEANAQFKVELFMMVNGAAQLRGVLGEAEYGPRMYATLPSDEAVGLHFVRVTNTAAASLFADSESFHVRTGGAIGMYQGADANLVDWDASGAAPLAAATWRAPIVLMAALALSGRK